MRGTVRSTKNEAKVAPLRNLYPGAKYPLELVEADLADDVDKWKTIVQGIALLICTCRNKNNNTERLILDKIGKCPTIWASCKLHKGTQI